LPHFQAFPSLVLPLWHQKAGTSGRDFAFRWFLSFLLLIGCFLLPLGRFSLPGCFLFVTACVVLSFSGCCLRGLVFLLLFGLRRVFLILNAGFYGIVGLAAASWFSMALPAGVLRIFDGFVGISVGFGNFLLLLLPPDLAL